MRSVCGRANYTLPRQKKEYGTAEYYARGPNPGIEERKLATSSPVPVPGCDGMRPYAALQICAGRSELRHRLAVFSSSPQIILSYRRGVVCLERFSPESSGSDSIINRHRGLQFAATQQPFSELWNRFTVFLTAIPVRPPADQSRCRNCTERVCSPLFAADEQ